MNLVGKHLKHKILGSGIVTTHNNDYFSVEFSSKTSIFQYKETTFIQFLTAEDPAIHTAILKEFSDIRESEAKQIAETAARQKNAEEQAAQTTTIVSSPISDPKSLPTSRTHLR